MADKNPYARYARLAPASALVAGALHSATSRMGHQLEIALAAELVASEVALPWTGPARAGVPGLGVHRFVMGAAMPHALESVGVTPKTRHALADFWFMSVNPQYAPSFLIQMKSGARISKSHRSGEVSALETMTSQMQKVGLIVEPVLCAFDAIDDTAAQKALGEFAGIHTWSGPRLCLALGIDYDRVLDRWESCAGDTTENDQHLANGLYASMVGHYGAELAQQMWTRASGQDSLPKLSDHE